MQAIAAVIFTGIAAVIGFTLFVVESWMEPTQPLIWGLVAICPALIGLAFAVSPSLRSSEERGMGLMMAVVALSVTMGIAPGVWSLAPVRVALLDAVAEGPALKKALDDEDAEVRLSACAKMMKLGEPVDEMFTVMNPSPGMATACMARAKDYAEREELTRRLANQWHQVLMASPEDDVCVQADALETLEVKKSAKGAMFLSCALSSVNAQTQACCSAHLESTVGTGAVLWTRIDPNVDSLFGLGVEDELFAASFGLSTNLAPAHVTKLGLGDDAVRRSMLERVCTDVVAEEASVETLEVMDYVFGERQECMSEEVKKSTPAREQVCARLLEDVANARDLDELVCQSQLDTAVLALKVYMAKLQAVDVEERKKMGAKIGRGAFGELLEKGDFEKFASNMTVDPNQAAKGYSSKDYAQMRASIDSQVAQMQYQQWASGGENNIGSSFQGLEDMKARLDASKSPEAKARMEALRAEFDDYDGKMAEVEEAVKGMNKMIPKRRKR
jgi:hypothetical protein